MNRTLPLLLTLLLIVPPPASAEPDTQPTTTDSLLRDLGAADFAARERAQRILTARGEPVRAAVEALAAETTDPEVRTRAAAVLRGIGRGSKFGQTRVMLHLGNVNPRVAFDALAAAGHAKLEYDSPGRFIGPAVPDVSVDADGEPFLAVFLRLCTDAGGELRDADGDRFVLHPDEPGHAFPTSFSGPFAVQAQRFIGVDERRSELDAARVGRTGTRSLALHLGFLIEPKLTLTAVADRPTVAEATDDRGQSLLPVGQPTGGTMTPRVGMFWGADLPLDPVAAEGAASLKTLRGSFAVEVSAETHRLSIDDPAAGKSAEVDGVRLTIASMRTEPPGDGNAAARRTTLALEVAHPPGDPMAASRIGTVALFDAAGHRFTTAATAPRDDGTLAHADLECHGPADAGPPTKLVWTLPGRREIIQLPFEFHDLPLP